MKIPLADQIAEIEAVIQRTLESVKSGALLPETAGERFPKLFAVLHTLKWLEEHMDWIREEAKRRK